MAGATRSADSRRGGGSTLRAGSGRGGHRRRHRVGLSQLAPASSPPAPCPAASDLRHGPTKRLVIGAISADDGTGVPRTLRKNQAAPRPPEAAARTRSGTSGRCTPVPAACARPAPRQRFVLPVDGFPTGQITATDALDRPQTRLTPQSKAAAGVRLSSQSTATHASSASPAGRPPASSVRRKPRSGGGVRPENSPREPDQLQRVARLVTVTPQSDGGRRGGAAREAHG